MKKYLFWILEAFIWALVIIIFIMGIFLYKNIKLKQKHSYHVFFTDTNGLRNGSPVKIMGKEIGYVSNVKVMNNDEIFVSFVITYPNISIPAGTKANIEYTGIVGSRSLELYPPKTNMQETSELIIPQNPARVQGAFTNSSRTAELIYTAATNVNKTIPVKNIPFIRKEIQNKSNEAKNFPEKLHNFNSSQISLINSIKTNEKLKNFNIKMEKITNDKTTK